MKNLTNNELGIIDIKTGMMKIDCTDKVASEIAEIIQETPMCELCIKDGKSLVVLDHRGFGVKELIIDKREDEEILIRPFKCDLLLWTGKNERDMYDFLTNDTKLDTCARLEEDTFRIDLCNGPCQTGDLIIKTSEGEKKAYVGDNIMRKTYDDGEISFYIEKSKSFDELKEELKTLHLKRESILQEIDKEIANKAREVEDSCEHIDEMGKSTIAYDSIYEARSNEMHCTRCNKSGSRDSLSKIK